jgi:hypothetical protein
MHVLPPLLPVLEAALKMKIASSYPLALCSVYTSSDVLCARLTYIFNYNVVISSSPMRLYQFTWQAEPWII